MAFALDLAQRIVAMRYEDLSPEAVERIRSARTRGGSAYEPAQCAKHERRGSLRHFRRLEEKFESCAHRALGPSSTAAAYARIMQLETLPDVRALNGCMITEPSAQRAGGTAGVAPG